MHTMIGTDLDYNFIRSICVLLNYFLSRNGTERSPDRQGGPIADELDVAIRKEDVCSSRVPTARRPGSRLTPCSSIKATVLIDHKIEIEDSVGMPTKQPSPGLADQSQFGRRRR